MNKKYAIFDMDGTLIDSMSFWQNLGQEFLASKGIMEDLSDEWESIEQMTMSESAAWFVQRFSLEETPEKAVDEMNAMMEVHYKNEIPLKKGIRNHLSQLKQNGVQMCVASVTAEYLIKACLERLGVLDCFDFILSCENMDTGKNSPQIYMEAAERFRAAPAEIAVYEDALYAIETAKKANFFVVAVPDDSMTEEQWIQISRTADEIFNMNS